MLSGKEHPSDLMIPEPYHHLMGHASGIRLPGDILPADPLRLPELVFIDMDRIVPVYVTVIAGEDIVRKAPGL